MKTRTIAGLLIVTSVTTAVGTNTYIHNREQEAIEIVEQENFKTAQQHLKEMKQMYTNGKVLEESLQAMNKMIVARGSIETSYRFSNKDQYVMRNYEGMYNMMQCLWGKLTYQDVTFTAKYNYNITYDLSKINIKYEGETLQIVLHETFMKIEDVQVDYDSAYVDENNGLLARDFNSNQTAAMISYSKDNTSNYIRSNRDFIENGMTSLQNNIKELCRQLGIENFEFKIYKNNTLTNLNEYMNVNNYSQESVNF